VHLSEEEAAAQGFAHFKPTAPGEPGVASWHLPSLIAPLGWRAWTQLAADWIAAQGDEDALKAFVNNELGECWRDTVRSEVGADALMKRAEQYDLMTCPQKGLVVVAAVDTQDNRLAIEIRAYGRGEESWGVFHGEIYGNPAAPELWQKLTQMLEAPIAHASGQIIRVDAAAIDAGGHHQEDVLAFCRNAKLRGKHWFAIRGARAYDAPKLGKPRALEFTYKGKPVPGGGDVRFLGTQSIKNLLDGRLRQFTDVATAGAGFVHFPVGYTPDYYKQLRSERREWRRDTQGNKALWWVKGAERNEAWDLLVYGYAAFLYVISGRHSEVVWREREKVYGVTPQLDMLEPRASSAQDATTPAPTTPPFPPRHHLPPQLRRGRPGGFASRWKNA
jgi:phage terminase large subunit GpA-like protein